MTTEVTMYVIWAVAIVVFGIFEGVTAQLVSIWFVLGSVAALIAAFCGAGIPLQIIVFTAVTLLTLVLTRPLVKKKLNTAIHKTNADRCIGQEAIVTENICNIEATGQVKADGKIWTARSSDGSDIPKDTIVTVEKIEGVKLLVTPKSFAQINKH